VLRQTYESAHEQIFLGYVEAVKEQMEEELSAEWAARVETLNRKYPWAVFTLEESDGRITPAFYGDEVVVRESCEAAMEGKRVWATGYWYASGGGRVFRVKEWSRVIDPPEGSALEEISEKL